MSRETETYLEWKENGVNKYAQHFQEVCCMKEWQLMKEDVELLQRYFLFQHERDECI